MSFLEAEHQEKIAQAYHAFADEAGFTHVADMDETAAQNFSLSIPLYVKRNGEIREGEADYDARSLRQIWNEWEQDERLFWQEMDGVVKMLDTLIEENVNGI